MGKIRINIVIKSLLFSAIFFAAAILPVYSWYSQLFPYNAGVYDEATVTYNARAWSLFDYSYAGYKLGETPLRNGIPCTTINITGSGDITAEVQAAVDTLETGGGGRVVIPPGTFTISSRITVNRNNISIEGSGSGRTVLNIPSTIVLLEGANDFQGVFTFEYTADGWNKGWPDRGVILSMVTNTIPEGSMYVTGLTNLANVAIGDWVTIQQYWWQVFSQQNSASVWQYYPPTYNRETTFTYLRRVINKDALGIYIDAPIPFHLDPANNPIHIRRSGPTAPSYQMLDNVGLSGVSIIFADNNSGIDSRPRGAGVAMEGAVNVWLYDVHVYNFPRYGFYFEYCARVTALECSTKKTQDYGGDGYGYGYHNYGTQNILIKKCYAEDVRHAYIFQKPLANYCVITDSDSIDCRQGEDTHHSFCHAILRDNLRHKNGNKMVGYNRGATSTNAYETYGTGVNWNVTGDGIGGVWESAIFSMNPAPYPAPYTHGIMVGGPGLYWVYDNGSHISGTYVEGDLIPAAAGLQVGPNGDKNQLYEGLGQAGLEPLSLYEEQLKNRIIVPEVWDVTCGGGPSVPADTPTPSTGPNHLVFNSEHAAWGSNFGSACPLPLNTLTPGTNLDDLGQLHSAPEGFRVDVTAGSNWTPMVTFGGPDLNTASYLSLEFWIYPSNSAMEFYLNLINDDAGTALGGSVTVNGSFAAGGVFTVNTWNRVTVPVANFAYSGVFNGIRLARTANAPGTFYMDDVYFVLNGTPTYTLTGTRTPSRTPTINPPVTLTFTRTRTMTPTYTRTNTFAITPTFTHTRTATPSATASGSPSFTNTRTPTYTRTNTVVITQTFTHTRTATPSATASGSPSFTNTRTPTYTRTNTVVITSTFTHTRTATPSATASGSPSYTNTRTPTYTRTNTVVITPTFTHTRTATPTYTRTNTLVITQTFTHTRTATPTYTRTNTVVITQTFTHTRTATPTYTRTNTVVITPTFTHTRTVTPTVTQTYTRTVTFTPAVSSTGTFTRTTTATSTYTYTRTFTHTITNSATWTATFTITPTWTAGFGTYTDTPTVTHTGTRTATASVSPSETITMTGTRTASVTPTLTYTRTRTATVTFTTSITVTFTQTVNNSPTRTMTFTITPTWTEALGTYTNTPTIIYTRTLTVTQVNSATFTHTRTASATASVYPSETITMTRTRTASVSPTSTYTRTWTATITETSLNTYTATPTVTRTFTATATFTGTRTATLTFTMTVTPTITVTMVDSVTITFTHTATFTRTPTNTFTMTGTPSYTVTATQTRTNTAVITPTFTPTSLPSPTATCTEAPESEVFEIMDVVVYPNPVIKSSSGVSIAVNLSQAPVEIRVRIYTMSFRAVREFTWDSGIDRGANILQIPSSRLGNLANGAYYYVIKAGNAAGEETKSRAGVLMILK